MQQNLYSMISEIRIECAMFEEKPIGSILYFKYLYNSDLILQILQRFMFYEMF